MAAENEEKESAATSSDEEAPANADAHDQASEDAEEQASAANEGEEQTAGSEEAAADNRKARRRKKKRPDDEDAPRDRNARVRQQHARKREARDAAPLTTGEMLDDAFARGGHALSKWASANAPAIAIGALVLILGGIGFGAYTWYSSNRAEIASAALMTGVDADRGRISAEPPKSNAEEEEITPTFKTAQERTDAALKSFEQAKGEAPRAGTATLARLGEAGVLLDAKKWDEALAAYREVKASPLAAADPNVQGRAVEGAAFALEGKGDKDAALKAFKELETISGEKGWKELAFYHQARLLGAKGDKDAALQLIKQAKERLATSGESRNYAYLNGVLDELHRAIDPASAPSKRTFGGADRQPSPDELMKLQQELMRQLQKAQQDQHE